MLFWSLYSVLSLSLCIYFVRAHTSILSDDSARPFPPDIRHLEAARLCAALRIRMRKEIKQIG